MKILYHSAAPWVGTGYGRVTREVATRLHRDTHHEVVIQSMAQLKNDPVKWHGEIWDSEEWKEPVEFDEPITILPTSNVPGNPDFGMRDVKGHFYEHDFDHYYTHFDTWMDPARNVIPDFNFPYSSYVIVDHHPCPEEVVQQVSNAQETVAISKYAELALEDRGIRPTRIPHGVNTDKYYPMDEDSDDYPNRLVTESSEGEDRVVDLGERFVIGMVAANHGDRKNIPNHLEAFNMFLQKVDDSAILYMHTQQQSPKGYDLRQVQKEIGIPDENIVWAPPQAYGNIQDEELNRYYNMFDVLMNCSFGEGWGLTITEAMSAGTPALVSNFSAMPEQLGAGPLGEEGIEWIERRTDGGFGIAPHGVVVDPCIQMFREKVSARQYICHPHDILKGIEWYYQNPHKVDEFGEVARDHVVDNYDWEDCVIPQFKEHFDRIEEQL